MRLYCLGSVNPCHSFDPAKLAAVAVAASVTMPRPAPPESSMKALQAGDVPTAEKELWSDPGRDPRAQTSPACTSRRRVKLRCQQATPMLLDAARRGYVPAMRRGRRYADGKGVPKSFPEAYKWIASPSTGMRRSPQA